jgi:hypothetical protein
MISEEEARSRILEKVSPLGERTIPLASALGRFSARDVAARLPLPNFDNSESNLEVKPPASNCSPKAPTWYGEPNAIGYAKFYNRSHDAMIRVYNAAGKSLRLFIVVMAMQER